MKKLAAISILLTFLTAAAFAQFKASVTAEFQADILRTAAPLDFASDTSKPNPLNNGTGIAGYEKRYFNFLSSMDYWKASELRLNLSYTDPDNKDDPKYGGLLQISVDGLWTRLITQGNAIDLGITTINSDPTLLDVVAAPFGDWNVWGRVGIFKGFVGNTDNRGATAAGRYDHYNNYMDRFKFANLGIMKLGSISAPFTASDKWGGPSGATQRQLLQHNDVDMSDLRSSFYEGAPYGDSAYASVEANLAPITVAVASDLSGVANKALHDGISPDRVDSHTLIGAAFRVSGDVLDMLKFDVVYKITGGERTTDQNQDTTGYPSNSPTPQPNGDGSWRNRFGLFGNVNLLNDTLGLTVGYSGEFRVRETGTVTNRADSYVYPYWNGVDLRAHFSGMDKLKISFNNNFSFSALKGASDFNTNVAGIVADRLGHSDRSEGYFGMYNALLADFNMTDDLLLSFQVGNRLYVYNYTDKAYGADGKTDFTADELQLAAAAFYSLGTHVTLGTGLAFNLYHQTLAVKGVDDIKAGLFTFGIPLTVKVVY